jgi:NurA-like 5'-3' nuclease
VNRGIEFFLIHHVYQSSHDPSKLLQRWLDKLTFPVFVFSDFLEILDILLTLGVRDERMVKAIDLLRSKQKSNGRWVLERPVSNMHVTFGAKGKENKWITYKALYALNRWEARSDYR